jgi:short-subunit dehydrogenase
MTTPITLITGASAGLGAEFARQLAGKRQKLVLVARRKDRIDALAAELGNARSLPLDLSEPGAAAKLMADIAAHGEHVETLVNNAGFGLTGRFAALNHARMREMIDLNCGVLTELCRAVVPGMIERKSGGILNVASTAAFQPGPGMAVYFASKAFVLSLTEALHEELRRHGIRVSALCPGPTATEFGDVAGFGKSIPKFAMAKTGPVVRAGIRGLEHNRAVAIPGLLNKLSGQGHRLLPRSVLRRITAAIKF